MPGQAGAEAIIGGTESKRHDPIYGPYLPQYDDLSSPLGWAPWVTWWVRRQRRRAAQEPREPRNPVDQPTPV